MRCPYPETDHKQGLPRRKADEGRAFTIIELLAATAVMAIIMVVIFGITQQIANAWRSTNSRVEAVQGARAAFDILTRTLGQATLNTYYDYDDLTNPTRYRRNSDLQFIAGKALVPSQVTQAVFFQAPLGYSNKASFEHLDSALNSTGFYIQYGADPLRPAFLDALGSNKPATRHRFRLMQFFQPTQNLSVYADAGSTGWFTAALASSDPPVHQIAENVIALVILPQASSLDGNPAPLVSDYEYDSTKGASSSPQPATAHQLPPLVEVVMVVIDEPSAQRLGNPASAPDVGLDGLFLDSSSEAKLENDIAELERRLSVKNIGYRVFRTKVPLPGAKWSS